MEEYPCEFCDHISESLAEARSHFAGHSVKPVLIDKRSSTILITLTDGCTPGRWEAAEEFANAFMELHKKFPSQQFQFVPFSMDGEGNTDSYLAIGQ